MLPAAATQNWARSAVDRLRRAIFFSPPGQVRQKDQATRVAVIKAVPLLAIAVVGSKPSARGLSARWWVWRLLQGQATGVPRSF